MGLFGVFLEAGRSGGPVVINKSCQVYKISSLKLLFGFAGTSPMRYILTVETNCGFYEFVTWKVSVGQHGAVEAQIIAFAVLTFNSSRCGNIMLKGACCLHRAIDKGSI